MKLKKRIILFGTVCILNTMAIGCGSATEATVKTEETQSDEILPEEETDALIKDDDKGTDESQENTAGKWQVLDPDTAAAVDADIPDSQLIHVMFEEDTDFYMRNIDGDEESHEYKEAGFQDLNEQMFVEMKGSFVNDVFYATEIRFF